MISLFLVAAVTAPEPTHLRREVAPMPREVRHPRPGVREVLEADGCWHIYTAEGEPGEAQVPGLTLEETGGWVGLRPAAAGKDPDVEGPVARDVNVGKASQIVVGGGGAYYVAEVTKDTKVIVNGKPAKPDDIRRGMSARVWVTRTGVATEIKADSD